MSSSWLEALFYVLAATLLVSFIVMGDRCTQRAWTENRLRQDRCAEVCGGAFTMSENSCLCVVATKEAP
jgi:hypothetical protein